MSDKSARIDSLSRYITLLRHEEKRLKWITASTSATNPENIEAAANLSVISEKLINAERELSDLEFGRPFKR